MARPGKVTRVTRRYLAEFFVRMAVFLLVAGTALACPERLDFTAGLTVPLVLLWGAVLVSMLAQLDPRSGLTTGCLKQYAVRFEPVPDWDRRALAEAVRAQDRGAVKVAAVWLAVNGGFGVLYHLGRLEVPALVVLCALCYLCDLICVLFFCPFQTFLMHNRCCVNCRIFAWGSWMMAAPLLSVAHWYAWSLCGAGLVVLVAWELRYRRHPERFWHGSNRNLQCGTCQEQLCRYKRPRSGGRKI